MRLDERIGHMGDGKRKSADLWPWQFRVRDDREPDQNKVRSGLEVIRSTCSCTPTMEIASVVPRSSMAKPVEINVRLDSCA